MQCLATIALRKISEALRTRVAARAEADFSIIFEKMRLYTKIVKSNDLCMRAPYERQLSDGWCRGSFRFVASSYLLPALTPRFFAGKLPHHYRFIG